MVIGLTVLILSIDNVLHKCIIDESVINFDCTCYIEISYTILNYFFFPFRYLQLSPFSPAPIDRVRLVSNMAYYRVELLD